VPETVSDTGPILHLGEIGRLTALSIVCPLTVPNLVWGELETRGFNHSSLRSAGVEVTVRVVEEADWKDVLQNQRPPEIQPADAQVFALVRSSRFQALALTDDLALRKLLEHHGATVAGTVGILVRAYSTGQLQRAQLESSIEALFHESTLHLSRAFRAYLAQLLKDL
jgi:predicted nucleic acid-binding protein